MEALGRLDGIRKDTRGRSERSTRPDPRGPWTHHLHPRGRCGGWGGHGWGAVGRRAGVSSGFRAPRAKIGYPSMFLFTFSGRQTRGPPGSWAEVGPQGVPQTEKIIEVKRQLSGSFSFELRGLGGFVWGCMARSDVSGALVILTDVAQSELKLFLCII